MVNNTNDNNITTTTNITSNSTNASANKRSSPTSSSRKLNSILDRSSSSTSSTTSSSSSSSSSPSSSSSSSTQPKLSLTQKSKPQPQSNHLTVNSTNTNLIISHQSEDQGLISKLKSKTKTLKSKTNKNQKPNSSTSISSTATNSSTACSSSLPSNQSSTSPSSVTINQNHHPLHQNQNQLQPQQQPQQQNQQHQRASQLVSRLITYSSSDIPQLLELQSLLHELSSRKAVVDARKLALDQQRRTRLTDPTQNQQPASGPQPSSEQVPDHQSYGQSSTDPSRLPHPPNSNPSPSSALIQTRKLKIKSLSNPARNSPDHPNPPQSNLENEVKPTVGTPERASLPPRIDIIKPETSPVESLNSLPQSVSSSSNGVLKRKKLLSGKKKRKRNGSGSLVSGSDLGEINSERDSPETSRPPSSYKARKIEHGSTPLPPSPPGDSLPLAARFFPTPPLPKVPPPPLPPSGPPPLPANAFPPLPSLPQSPLLPVNSLHPIPPPPEISSLIDTIPPSIFNEEDNSFPCSVPGPETATLLSSIPTPKHSSSPLKNSVTAGTTFSPRRSKSTETKSISSTDISNVKPLLPLSENLETSTSIGPSHTPSPEGSHLPLAQVLGLNYVPEEDAPEGFGAQPLGQVTFTEASASQPRNLTPAPTNHPLKAKEKDTPGRKHNKAQLKFGLALAQIQKLAPAHPSLSSSTPTNTSFFPASNKSLTSSASHANTPVVDHTGDFTLNLRTLHPTPPKISSLPPSFSQAQVAVNQDFSKTKTPSNQVPIHQFQNWVNDNYLRSYGEDDLAFLSLEYSSINGCLTRRPSQKPDSIDHSNEGPQAPADETDSTFEIPPLGRYYSEVWREEDLGIVPPSTATAQNLDGSTSKDEKLSAHSLISRTRPSDLTDSSILSEKVEVGPLTERLISTIQPVVGRFKQASDAKDKLQSLGPPKENISSAAHKLQTGVSESQAVPSFGFDDSAKQIDSVELEDRVTRELRYIGILSNDELVDWSKREDDEISTALRATQKALKNQAYVNSRRKARISEIVRARMAYQEFEQIKEGLDRLIEQGWNKRLRSDSKKKSNNKRKPVKNKNKNQIVEEEDEALAGGARLPLPDYLLVAIQKRQDLIAKMAPIFQRMADSPSVELQRMSFSGGLGAMAGGSKRFTEMPTKSVYSDLEEEFRLKSLDDVC